MRQAVCAMQCIMLSYICRYAYMQAVDNRTITVLLYMVQDTLL